MVKSILLMFIVFDKAAAFRSLSCIPAFVLSVSATLVGPFLLELFHPLAFSRLYSFLALSLYAAQK